MAPKTRSQGKAKSTPTSGAEETQGTSGTKRTTGTKGTSGTGGRKPKDAQPASKQEEIVSMLREIIDLEKTIGGLEKTIGNLEKTIGNQKETIAKKDRVIADKDRVIDDKDRVIDDKDRVIADKDRTISELERKLEPHQDSTFDKFKAYCSDIGNYIGSIFSEQPTYTSELISHNMNAVTKIESIKVSQKDFDDRVKKMYKNFDYIFKKKKFLSKTLAQFSTNKCQDITPKDKTELTFLANSAVEGPAIIAANVIYEEVLGIKNAISLRRDKLGGIETEICNAYKKEAGGKYNKVIEGIENLKPDGFIYVKNRSNPIIVSEYRAPYKITEENYKNFVCESLEDSKISESKGNNAKHYYKLFQQINTHMTKYGSEHGYVTSGYCWIFYFVDPNNPGELKHYAIFVKNQKTWEEAFEILLAMLLKPLLDYLEKDDPEKKWNGQDNLITNFKERFELFKQGTIEKDKQEKKEDGDNSGNGNNDDKNNEGDNEGDTTKHKDSPSKRTSMDAELKSDRESKRQCISTKQDPRNEKNENEEKTAKDEDVKSSNQNTIASSTSPVKTPEKPPVPLAEYCTQKCLLGLKKNLPMDKNCPNYNIHKQNSRDKKLHPISCNKLVSLFTKQLENDKESLEYCDSKKGAVGKMAKITVYPYGYTIVGKVRFFAYDYNAGPLKYEAAIYKQIEDLQGKWVPVFLGYVETYYQNCILLSYGGENPETEEDYNHDTVDKIDDILLEHGVDHDDIRRENIVLNKELGHEMLIDFHVSNCDELYKGDYYTIENGKILY